MSISTTLSSFHWQERKINLLDTPGEPSFIADALGALRVCESAVFVVNAVMGVEVSTTRLWARAAELDIARMLFVNMLDRERADFFRTLEQLKRAFGPHAVATEIPIGSEHDVQGVIDLVDMKAYRQDSAPSARGWSEIPIPDAQVERAGEYREKLMDEVCEVSDSLMERYLEGEEISHAEIVDALKEGTNHGKIFPVVCGVATRNLGTTRLLDAIVEDLPSPVKHGSLSVGEVELSPSEDGQLFAYVFKTQGRPVRRADQPAARLPGRAARRQPGAEHARARQGADRPAGGVLPARTPSTCRSSVRETSARWPSSRRRAPATGWPRGRADRHARAEAALAGDGLRGRAQEPRRRGQGALLAAPPAGGGPHDRPAPRPADRRADRRRASRRCTWK